MAVTNSIMLGVGLSGSVKGKSPLSERRSFTAQWQITTAQTDTAETVIEYFRGSGSHPYLGDSYAFGSDSDAQSFCVSIDPRRVPQSLGTWIVSVEYEPTEGKDEPEERDDENGKKTDDPLLWHDEISIDYTQITIPAELAQFRGCNLGGLNGQPIPPLLTIGRTIVPCNSAFVPFDPGIDMEVDVKIVRITKNVREYDGNRANGFIGCVNTDQVTINKRKYGYRDVWGPLTARIKNISGSFHLANRIPFWKETTEVHITPVGWRRLICDRGLSMILTPELPRPDGSTVSSSDSDRNTLVPVANQNGQPITEPVLFNGKGRPLNPFTEVPVWLEYQLYAEIPFAPLKW